MYRNTVGRTQNGCIAIIWVFSCIREEADTMLNLALYFVPFWTTVLLALARLSKLPASAATLAA